jgi:transcriptional regulator with PAS, ATPase and Fis domain
MKIKFALVVPEETFVPNANEIFQEHNKISDNYGVETYLLDIRIIDGQAIKKNQLANDYDAIITRGLLAQILPEYEKRIPIVEILVPVSDMLTALENCYSQYGNKKVAIIASERMIGNMKDMSRLSKFPVNTYPITDIACISNLVDQAISDGCEIILGGTNACKYAEKLGISNMYIKTSRESFWQSLSEAKWMAYVTRREQEKNQRLTTILKYTNEGVIALDQNNCLTTINPIAAKALNISPPFRTDGLLSALPVPPEFLYIAQSNNEYKNHLIKFNNAMFNLNKILIWIKGNIYGKVITFQEISSIQELEHKIRTELHNAGHIARATFASIIGQSKIMTETIATARQFSIFDTNILLLGQSGTGKELFAQSIHNDSPRKKGPFVAVNCAAIAESLLESELFGYAEGAFTGAQKGGKKGFFELAHNGTIFLDEIGEIPLNLQSKFLRVLQEREIIRLGDGKIIPVNIRIIAATNMNLENLVHTGKFREDLFYRLDVLRINIPSLDERKEDIPLLIDYFLRQKFPYTKMSEAACKTLCSLNWPGNIRQLLNICERLAILNKSGTISDREAHQVIPTSSRTSTVITVHTQENPEKEQIERALGEAKYSRTHAAKLLNMSRSTLWRKMREYKL